MQTKRRATTVAILGPFGWGNLGDAAIQDAVIAQLRSRRADLHIVGISMVPADTRQRHGIETYAYDADTFARRRLDAPDRMQEALRRRFPRLHRVFHEMRHVAHVVRTLRAVDLLLVSGGGQLDEFWGGPWHHPFALLKWTTLARLTRTKVAFLSVGAGSIASRLSRWFLRLALRQAHYRSYRDAGSLAIVRERLHSGHGDPVVPDMAFALPVSTASPASRGSRGGLVVAVGPMAYCHPKFWPNPDRAVHERYVSVLAQLCQQLILRNAALTFFVGEVSHDAPVIQDVCRRLTVPGGPAAGRLVVVPRMESVDALISCLSDADVVITSRFHGALLALLLRRPVLALSYERKVKQLMTDLGQGKLCVDIEQAGIERLTEMFADLESRRDSIVEELDRRVKRETDAVLAQFDRIVAILLPTPAPGNTATASAL